MTRRVFLLLGREPSIAPDDWFKLNKFAELYNEYIAKLQAGQRDLRQWRIVTRAFEKLS